MLWHTEFGQFWHRSNFSDSLLNSRLCRSDDRISLLHCFQMFVFILVINETKSHCNRFARMCRQFSVITFRFKYCISCLNIANLICFIFYNPNGTYKYNNSMSFIKRNNLAQKRIPFDLPPVAIYFCI